MYSPPEQQISESSLLDVGGSGADRSAYFFAWWSAEAQKRIVSVSLLKDFHCLSCLLLPYLRRKKCYHTTNIAKKSSSSKEICLTEII